MPDCGHLLALLPRAFSIRSNVYTWIDPGKQCTRLAMTWDDKISFVLTESLAIKGIKPLDVITEKDTSTRNDEERFDNDMMLMTGELAKMMADIVEALGGEAKA